MNRVPHRRIEPMWFMSQASDHHRSGVHAYREGQARAVLWFWERLLQGMGRENCPSSVIFIGYGSTKQGHEAIHPILDHVAAILLHSGLHMRQ